MAELTSPPPERKPTQPWRSQASSNWRMKDATPRPEAPPRPQQRTFDARREQTTSPPTDSNPSPRLYVGNLLYSAKPEDVQSLFTDSGFTVTNINMSVDPFTGRNPSYCFVDLESAEEAARAMSELGGMEVLGRPVRINPGVKKVGTGTVARREWGPRGGDGGMNGNGVGSRTTTSEYRTPSDRFSRPSYSSTSSSDPTSKRLYVGGLPKLPTQTSIDAEIHAIFSAFTITAISKQISPHPSKITEGANENYYYLFVDLGSSEDAERAIGELDGKEMYWGGRLRVNRARGENKRVVKDRESGRGMVDGFRGLKVGEGRGVEGVGEGHADQNGNGTENRL